MGSFFTKVLSAIVAILRGAPNNPQVGPFPPLDLRITSVSNATPNIGDTVEISWDYDSSERLSLQAVQLHSLDFDGRFATQTFGSLPQALLHAGERQPNSTPLGLGQRAIQFPFISPVTFHLIAEDDDGRILQKFIKFTLPGMSFSLTVKAGGGLAGDPRLPGPTDGACVIAFEKAFGIYESTRLTHDEIIENGLIDQLERETFKAIFSPDAPFFLSSLSANESEHFRSALGRAFPRLLSDFLGRRDGRQFAGLREFADAVIVAVTFAIEGSVESIATDSGKCDVITSSVVKDIEPIFVQIDTRSKPGDPTHPVICNLHAGNIPQGMVLATFHDNLRWQGTLNTGSSTTIAVDLHPGSAVRTTSGQITEAKIGLEIARTGDPRLFPMRTIIDLEWDNIPVFPDTDLSELFATQYQLP